MGTTERLSRRGVVVVASAVAVVVGVVAWRLVTAPDLSPVPLVAQGPYLCDGVPLAGAELILGGPVEVKRTVGEWGSDERSFACVIERGGGAIDVYEEPISSGPIPDPQMFLEQYRSSPVTEEFEVDALGSGFYTQHPSTIQWLCGDRFMTVTISGTAAGRDKKADVIAYLSSMLPWGCGNTEPPEADPQP